MTNFGRTLSPFLTGLRVNVSAQGVVVAQILMAGEAVLDAAMTVAGVMTNVLVDAG